MTVENRGAFRVEEHAALWKTEAHFAQKTEGHLAPKSIAHFALKSMSYHGSQRRISHKRAWHIIKARGAFRTEKHGVSWKTGHFAQKSTAHHGSQRRISARVTTGHRNQPQSYEYQYIIIGEDERSVRRIFLKIRLQMPTNFNFFGANREPRPSADGLVSVDGLGFPTKMKTFWAI